MTRSLVVVQDLRWIPDEVKITVFYGNGAVRCGEESVAPEMYRSGALESPEALCSWLEVNLTREEPGHWKAEDIVTLVDDFLRVYISKKGRISLDPPLGV